MMRSNWRKRNVTGNLKELSFDDLLFVRDMFDALADKHFARNDDAIENTSRLYLEYDLDLELVCFTDGSGNRWVLNESGELDYLIECDNCGYIGVVGELFERPNCSECVKHSWVYLKSRD